MIASQKLDRSSVGGRARGDPIEATCG